MRALAHIILLITPLLEKNVLPKLNTTLYPGSCTHAGLVQRQVDALYYAYMKNWYCKSKRLSLKKN